MSFIRYIRFIRCIRYISYIRCVACRGGAVTKKATLKKSRFQVSSQGLEPWTH